MFLRQREISQKFLIIELRCSYFYDRILRVGFQFDRICFFATIRIVGKYSIRIFFLFKIKNYRKKNFWNFALLFKIAIIYQRKIKKIHDIFLKIFYDNNIIGNGTETKVETKQFLQCNNHNLWSDQIYPDDNTIRYIHIHKRFVTMCFKTHVCIDDSPYYFPMRFK